MSTDDNSSGSSALRSITKLRGMDSFVQWETQITAYLIHHGAHAAVLGLLAEPNRRAVDPLVPGDHEIVFPTGHYAGLLEPNDDQRLGAWTQTLRAAWTSWQKAENVARGAIYSTVERSVLSQYKQLWSAHDIFEALCTQFRLDTAERKSALKLRLNNLYLSNVLPESMRGHLKSFNDICSELEDIEAPISEKERLETFFNSVHRSLEEPLRSEFRAFPVDQQTWAHFTRLVTEKADRIARQNERAAASTNTPAVSALVSKDGLDKAKKRSRAKRGGGNNGNRSSSNDNNHRNQNNKQPRNNSSRQQHAQTGMFCTHCERDSHNTADCRRKAAGLPSRKAIQEFEYSFQQKRTPRSNDGISNLSALAHLSAITSYESSSLASVSHDSECIPLIIDTGATHHVVADRSLLRSIVKVDPPRRFKVGSSNTLFFDSSEIGTLTFEHGKDVITIPDVYYAPVLGENVISDIALERTGWILDTMGRKLFNGDTSIAIERAQGMFGGRFHTWVPKHGTLSSMTATLPAGFDSPLFQLHRKLGHLGRSTLLKAAEDKLLGDVSLAALRRDRFTLAACDTCQEARGQALPKKSTSPRGSKSGERVHADIKGMMQPSINGCQYWLGFVTDFTGLRLAFPMSDKTKAFPQLKAAILQFELHSQIRVAFVRTDRGTEFTSGEAQDWFTSKGIIHEVSPPYVHELNGVAERLNGYMATMLRCMLIGAGLPHEYWEYACTAANMVLNVTRKNEENKTPWQYWSSRPLNVVKLLEYGLVVYALVLRPAPKNQPTHKSDLTVPKRVKCRILCFSPRASAWLVLVEHNREVAVSRDISLSPTHAPREKLPPAPPVYRGSVEPKTDAVPAPYRHPQLSAVAITNSIVEGEETHHLASIAAEQAFYDEDPKTVAEALALPDAEQWIEAMKKEIDNLVGKGTWSEAKLPKHKKAVTAKWVFKRKRDADGNVVKYKARLVGRGFSQIPGVDFEETYAPVGRSTSLLLILSIAARYNLELRQADVEGAYLNGTIDIETYLLAPDGVELETPGMDCLRLHKTIYGLRQSGRAWWLELMQALQQLGFTRCESDWGVYVLRNSDGTPAAFLLAYVDDLILATSTKHEADIVVQALSSFWKISDLGEVTHILGMKVGRDRSERTIHLSQATYIDQLVTRFKAENIKSGKYAPLPQGELPAPSNVAEDAVPARAKIYKELVGALLWLSGRTRPDIAFAVSYLGRSACAPTEQHLALARRVLAYLRYTRDLVLTLGGTEDPLQLFVDSDWAGCVQTRRSTTGYCVFLFGGLVSWCSRRQGSTAASTMEAEYVAPAEATREVVWLRALLSELGLPLLGPTVVNIDNEAALRLGNNPTVFARSKHIDIKHHIVREKVEDKIIELRYIPTDEQRADILTKSLPGIKHTANTRDLGLTIKTNP
ncbi:Gag-Pol [Trichosporon asahii var. asahii CBS 2479]|uniref:Gag-Pol n=1 Tax=Trichosporon asahii var. asahii (strain ATCC 90039 / CBS 2479 / JCM 2466 / KCTC 7840 / NBRC 103889/ NCYC 2677 / UAMH 7654) TaxID=1186058 RepID=J6ERE3_TRIAS|nr:Gag-Pol [Trichosporon asahii var. asahii CBS 2479]EJT45287.1 Gag-Pol [Trichosporon asahii var. asahii CBS 2479]